MKTTILHKEVSLIVGILVAVIVVLTLWMNHFPAGNEAESISPITLRSSIQSKQSQPVKLIKKLFYNARVTH